MFKYFLIAGVFALIGCNTQKNSTELTSTHAVNYQPTVLTTWQWQLQGDLNTEYNAANFDIDLFDTSQSEITQLQQQGKKVICYFSAGSYENWREDATDFDQSNLGATLDGWVGEKWLDIRSTSVRNIMEQRIQLASDKGCDAVEPDNIDGYTNNTSFNLSADDQLSFNIFLADNAHRHNMAIALKIDVSQVSQLVRYFDFAVNEQCYEFDECHLLKPFTAAGKAVLHVEYAQKYVDEPHTRQTLCNDTLALKFSTLVLPLALDDRFRYSCF